MELPSASDLEDVADTALSLAELDFESFSWEEVLEAYQEFCRLPVVVFARRLCDVVTVTEDT